MRTSSLYATGLPCSEYVSYSTPLLSNIMPHLQTLVNFVSNTLPKPVLFALIYRLVVMHFASHILPTIGADSWEDETGVDDGWDGRPVCSSYPIILLPMALTVLCRRRS